MSGTTYLNPLSTKLTKWPNTLKQFVGNLPTNCLSVFGHFVGLALIGLSIRKLTQNYSWSKFGDWFWGLAGTLSCVLYYYVLFVGDEKL